MEVLGFKGRCRRVFLPVGMIYFSSHIFLCVTKYILEFEYNYSLSAHVQTKTTGRYWAVFQSVCWKIEASSQQGVQRSDVRHTVYSGSGKVTSERIINRSDTQTPRHMFLISLGSNNIMVEVFSVTVISRYQRLSLVRGDSGDGRGSLWV